MRKPLLSILLLLISLIAAAKSVDVSVARQAADRYFSFYSGRANPVVSRQFSIQYNGITTYHVFNYEGGGFVVVAADDAVFPVLAQSNESYIEDVPENPSLKYWFEGYSKQIAHIIAAKYDNTETRAEWQRILDDKLRETDSPAMDVTPLLTTNWDQGQYYNYYCPAETGGSGGKCWTGCVATAMGQIMKYYNFPASGAMSHSYVHETYGKLECDFGNTTYDFASMGSKALSTNYQAIAKLLYHAGVAVNMDYNIEGSGAFSSDVAWALSAYFSYDESTIKLANRTDYTIADWKTLLKQELSASRPVFYSGSGTSGGHAWVCDGFRSSDDKFHMNWGWSGVSDGYFTITALNTGSGSFNTGNQIVYGIRPDNSTLAPRITNLTQHNTFTAGTTAILNCKVYSGTPVSVKLYFDDQLLFSTAQPEFTYTWNTGSSLGMHMLKIVATDGTTTADQQLPVGISEWQSQPSAFTAYKRGINFLHAVDKNNVWGIALDGISGTTINEFTRTSDGGQSWKTGKVLGGNTYGLGNICGLDDKTAFVALYSGGDQDNTCGIYKTADGGTTWVQLPGALQGAASFADNVWFWNQNEGMCHGDVKDNYFEIYTTNNGGATWNRVPKNKIGNGVTPVSGEGGWTTVIATCGDSTVAFGTNKGKVYISNDRGYTWNVSSTGITPTTNGGINMLAFKDKMNGLAAQTSTTMVLKSTTDGGTTWTTIVPSGPFLTSNLAFVPGTANTYVSSGNSEGLGISYSFDGGLTWSLFPGTENENYLALDFIDNKTGWAGSFNENATLGGIFKFTGILQPAEVLGTVSNLAALTSNGNVDLTWNLPAGDATGYRVYRNDSLIASVTEPRFHDQQVAIGAQNYCVTALYAKGESAKVCITAWITLNIQPTEEAAYNAYPNPATTILNVVSPVRYDEVRLINSVGKVVFRQAEKGTNMKIDVENLPAGMYILQIINDRRVISKKISIK